MSRKYINKLFVLFISLSLFGCKDFIEKNISEDTPVLILPANNTTINANPVHIKWEELEGATKYRIEIVSPEFGNIQSYPLDSVVTGTNFFFGLDSAQYEIRITAMNAGFSSKPSTIRRFWVGTSLGGANSVILTSPNPNSYANVDFTGNFAWNILPNAESYTFELHQSSTFAGSYVISPIDQIGITSINAGVDGSDLAEGTYCWGVKAYLVGGGETNFAKRVFYIDKTNSPAAGLSQPANNSAIGTGNITFSWTLPADIGVVQSPRTTKLQIAHDTGFTNLVEITPDVFSTQTTKDVELLTPGTYYWRVIVIDEAGNMTTPPSVNYYTLTLS